MWIKYALFKLIWNTKIFEIQNFSSLLSCLYPSQCKHFSIYLNYLIRLFSLRVLTSWTLPSSFLIYYSKKRHMFSIYIFFFIQILYSCFACKDSEVLSIALCGKQMKFMFFLNDGLLLNITNLLNYILCLFLAFPSLTVVSCAMSSCVADTGALQMSVINVIIHYPTNLVYKHSKGNIFVRVGFIAQLLATLHQHFLVVEEMVFLFEYLCSVGVLWLLLLLLYKY